MKYLLLAFLFIGTTWAKEGGNGGHAVVCRDENRAITWIRLLDIYEGEILYKRSYTSAASTDTIINKAMDRMKRFPSYRGLIEEKMDVVSQNVLFVDESNELVLTEDAFPPVLKKGCKFEQLAAYTTDNILLISKELYDAVSDLDRAALMLHESIYALNRELGETNSLRARRSVAFLLADNFVEDEFSAAVDRTPVFFSGKFQGRRHKALCDMKFEKVNQTYLVSGTLGCINGRMQMGSPYPLNLIQGSDSIFELRVKSFTSEFIYYIQFEHVDKAKVYYRFEDVAAGTEALTLTK